jgi:hypothetical protein
MYAGEIAALIAQQPLSTSKVLTPGAAGMVYYPPEEFRRLPNGALVAESTYQEALRQGTLADLIHEYTAYGTAREPGEGLTLPGQPGWTGATPAGKTAQQAATASAGVTRYYPRVSLSNLSRPGQPFQVGDELLLQIGGGQPNAPVNATATHNGSSSTSDFGRTDAGGFFQLPVQMSEAEIGAWQETWRVGPEEASPRLSFSVAAKPSAAATGAGGGQAAAQQEQQEAASAAPAILDQIKALPWWVWAALGGGIFLLRKA